MTRFRALVLSGALVLGLGFGGCFGHGGDDCESLAASTGVTIDPCDN